MGVFLMKMKQNANRLLSLVLSMVMVLQLLPVSVFAADELSGTCGENLTWRINGDTLFIEGEGAMYDYGGYYDELKEEWVENPAPWSEEAYAYIELDDRITYIGQDAFSGNRAESIELPAGLEGIGNGAFLDSRNLTKIVLPEGLTEMGDSAFGSCHALKTVTIPSTLKVIPQGAFDGCINLTDVTIAEGVEEIGAAAFANCFDMLDYSGTGTYFYFNLPGLERIEIPGSVKKIGEHAFSRCGKLTEVVLHEGLEEIGENAFFACNYLWEVTIPSTVEHIGPIAFMPGPLDVAFNDMPIMYQNPIGARNLYILSDTVSAWSSYPPSEGDEEEGGMGIIGGGSGQAGDPYVNVDAIIHAYEGSKAAEEITAYNTAIEEGTETGEPIPFYPIPKGHNFSDYTSVDEENHSRTCTDDGCTVEDLYPHTIVIDMENWSAQSCETDGYFRWICSACDYAEDFIREEAYGHDLSTDYDQYADYHTSYCYTCGKDIELPHEWSYVSDPTATGPYEVEAICSVCGYTATILAGTSGICGPNLTWRIEDETLYIEGEGPMYDYGIVYDDEGNSVTDDEGYMVANPTPWRKGSYTRIELDDRITHIGKAAFGREEIDNYYSGHALESIELPSKLESIGDYAFCTIFGVEEIVLPEGLTEMGVGAFANCEDLKSVTIPSTLKVIPEQAFEMCFQLENVTIAEGVEEIGPAAFMQCNDAWNSSNYENFAAIPGLKRIEIPGSVKRIGSAAFYGNVTLTELVLHEGLEEIADTAFTGCNYLRSVTIPSTVKTIDVEAFSGDGADMWLGDNSFMDKDPKGPMNIYVLSKDLSLYAPLPDWADEDYEPELWISPSAAIHAYPDSVIAREIELYNDKGEYEHPITFYPLTAGEHDFSDWVKVDEEGHSRICDDCGAEEVRPHTLVVDMYNYTIKACGVDEQYRWVCTECDYAGAFYTDPEWKSAGHDLVPDYDQYADYHTTWCRECYEDIQLPHEWSYIPDPEATEPYEVEALCTVCMYERVITVIPVGSTIIHVSAQDENGDAATLPEGSYTIRWEDSDGNTLGAGNTYTHAESWDVTEENPVIAVISFNDELRSAYNVGAEVRHTVTALGTETEYLLTARTSLTVKGTLKVKGLTYLPVNDAALTLTTTVADVETEQVIDLVRSGEFTAQIRRAPTRLDFRCTGYSGITLDNIQMMSAVDGVIDLGTITLTDTMVREYMTTVYTDAEQMALAEQLAESDAVITAVNERTGEEYHGVRVCPVSVKDQPASGYRFWVTFGGDMDQYFQTGDSVTIRCSQTDSVLNTESIKFDPYTFTIARGGEQSELALSLYRTPRLDIGLNCKANIYLFDSEGRIVFSGFDREYHRLLERGTYTLVCFRENDVIPTIDAPEMLEDFNVPTDIYVKDTFTITEDIKLEYQVPYFLSGSQIGVAVECDVNRMENGLVPMTVLFNETFKNTFEEGEKVRFTFEGSAMNLPIKPIGGKYAFGDKSLGLQEEANAITLTVTAQQPGGSFVVYVKPTGEYLNVMAEGSSGITNYLVFQLPSITSEVRLAGLSNTRSNPNGNLWLYTKLPGEAAPYTAQLYVNNELQSETELNIQGEGKNIIPLKLKAYGDGDSTHNVLVNVVDKDGELVWTSLNQMVTLTKDSVMSNAPSELAIRVNWSSGDADGQIIRKTIDLKKDPGAFINIPVNPNKLNKDGTLGTDTVFDYALKMDDNSRVKNNVVSMRVFCNEEALEPTIHTVALKYNELSDSFEGTLTLKANTYTVRDLPYGYSFDYTTTRPGSSAETERPPFSAEQLVDTLEAQAAQREQWASDMDSNVFAFYDPDDVEFTLENTEGLTDEQKEMFRVLLSISNDLYTMQEEAAQNNAAVVADRYGEEVLSDSPVESVQKITSSVSDQTECAAIPEGSTSADALLEAGYEKVETSYGDFHLNIDESGAATVVDLQNLLSTAVSMDSTEQDLETTIEYFVPSFFTLVHTTLDLAIESVEKAADFYSNLLIRKLGLEGNIDRLDDTIAKYKTYLGLLEDPITWKSGDYGKDLKMISLEIVEELEELEQTRKQIDEFKKTLKSFKADLALTEKSIHLANLERPNLHKYLPAFQFMNSGAGKVLSFAVLDLYGILVSAIGVVDAIDVARARENTIENAQDRADRMLAYSNAAAKCTGMTPPDACEEAYDEYIVEGEDAKDWNTAWFRTKVGQAIGSVASVAAGAFIKGVPGIVASVGIGLVGGAAEWACLAGFNDSIDDMQEIWLEVETNCMKEYELSDEEQECVAEELGHGSEEEDGESGAGNLPDGNDGNNGEEKPEYPIGTKPQIDPSGYVYEAVASNRIEGATAKIYYEGDNGEEIYWSEAHLYGEVNPQITDAEGRFAWMTPIGNWLVKITKDGYLNADSSNDPAAVDGWLPVPPPQLDVNIAMVSKAAPEVLSAAVAADQAQVVFSQYMDVAQFASGDLITVTQNGVPISVTAVFTDAEESPTDETVYYGRILQLTRTDGQPFSGSGIEIGIRAEAKNYAGNAMESAYASGALTATQILGSLSHSYPNRYVTDIGQTEQIVVQVLDTAGQPMAGVTVTAKQKLGGTMEMSTSAVSDASGRAVFTVKGISSGYDMVTFEAGVVRAEMNTRVSPLGSTAPQKPTANLSDYAAVEDGTQLILTYPGTEDVVIYYTTNNTCPCTDSDARKIYDGPITITEDTYFRVAAWTQAGGYSERLNLHITVKAEDMHICKDHLVRVEAKPTDCTVDGSIEYYECSCGKWYSDATASVEITDKDSVVIKASHDYGTLIDEVPAVHTATELKAGMKAHYFCDECDTYFTAEKVETTEAELIISAPTHNYATVNGYKEADGHADTCSCGAHDTVVGHTPNIPVATETEDQKCSVCGYVMATATGKSSYLVTAVGSYASITGGGEYETGETVTVYSGSRSGYSFNGWTSSDVTITNANSATASFVMPDHAVTVTANWTKNSSSGGGGSYVPVTYTNKVATTKNGAVSVEPTSAAKGETVTVTVIPDKGYTLEILTVTDKNGKEVELTNNGDGQYTFKMPASKITVTATFMDDNTMLNFFADVSADAYYYDAVLWAAKAGITSGTTATTFSPDNPCTRAQMATFLWRAADSPDPVSSTNPFADIATDAYYAKAVQWAYEQGITGGTSATTFSPDQTCTRGQMATFLWRNAGSPAVVVNSDPFADVPDATYYAAAVQWAYEEKITSGTGATTFSPNDPCTRAQMVTFLYRHFVK